MERAGKYEAVRVETRERVTTVVLDRPERRNAVDGPMAAELAAAFRAFDADPGADVAVLTGAGGTFCAGADLKAVGTDRQNAVADGGDGREHADGETGAASAAHPDALDLPEHGPPSAERGRRSYRNTF